MNFDEPWSNASLFRSPLFFQAALASSGGARLRVLLFPSSGTMEALFTQKVRNEDRKMVNNVFMDWAQKENVEVLAVQVCAIEHHSVHFDPFFFF